MNLRRASTCLALSLLSALSLTACGDSPRDPRDPAGAGPTSAPAASGDPERFADELVIDLVDGTPLEDFLAKHPGLRAKAPRWNSVHSAEEGIALVAARSGEADALLAEVRADPLVEAAERNALLRLPVEPAAPLNDRWLPDDDSAPPRSSFPNDPHYDKQWNMRMVRAEEAWKLAGKAKVIVAVIDTGVAYEETKGVFAPDLRGTGFVPGYDFVNDDAVPADDHGHGTHCAGTIAQSTDNKRGVVGLAPGVLIMPLKVLSAEGWGTVSDIADAIRFAADEGADVLSMSLGGGAYSPIMKSAVDYALAKGCVVVAAAGNANRDRVEYPAAYPGVLAITAVGPSGARAFYSSYGREAFIAAPGGDMREGPAGGVLQNTVMPRSETNPTVYAYFQGTSMATPHVAAAAALLRQAGVTRPEAIRKILAETAKGSGWNKETGYGILDAGAALQRAQVVPSGLGAGLALLLLLPVALRTTPRAVARGPLLAGALLGAGALGLLAPLVPQSAASLGTLGQLLIRAPAEWSGVLLGNAWGHNALAVSALLPALLGVACLPGRITRGLGIGLCLGWAAHLGASAYLSYADVVGVPGMGLLDQAWLVGNGLVLVAVAAYLARLGRTKFGAAVPAPVSAPIQAEPLA